VSTWDGLPKSIRVIGKRYKVAVVEKVDEEGSDGDSCAAALTIQVRDDPAHGFDYVREVALHEAIHAVEHQMHLCLSEEHVEGLGVGILALLRENPAFVRWLMAKEPRG
jgi:hypothetical protein